MRTIREMIEDFEGGAGVLNALEMLGHQLREGRKNNTRSTLVLILERPDGNAVMVVAVDGKHVHGVEDFTVVVTEVAAKGRLFALAMKRS